ncbi:TPA: DUF4411 family protein [Morganella morganii]|uniref:DUF4411 family protein n=1 Tax=Morganella morganii TaxID=582 RepID=UPI001F2E8580|nr:DUF4411 family protein [Morganella morganii]MCF1266575.1 DUF4411 family protein [Morganella morganii]MDW7795923.1 DUF4411 family protein [Morganella morganii]HCQ8178241.1 DUF4411 family protein [Morganella morganii]HDU8602127.1 DUF4411 family protein [Morganella morganii]
MSYLIDANIFIQAQQDYYCFDLCPGFWQFMESKFRSGEVISIRNVYDELQKRDDKVCDWSNEIKHCFQSVDDHDTQKTFSEIANYVFTEYSPRHENSLPHIQKFLSVADPWIIAKAKTTNSIVVTHEVRNTTNGCRPKIPDICDYFNVKTIRTNELLRNFQVQFILSQQ